MTPAARVQAFIEILGMLEENRAQPGEQVVNDYLRRRRYIGSKDRRAVTALTYDILRHRARIGWWLVRAGGVPAEARQQVLAYLLCSAGESPESLRGLFDGARYAPPPLTSEEAALVERLAGPDL
ncbi:MAG TPA: rRNA cytosine-C5-methylase, partial [Kiloniellaceae bacterium]